LTANKTLRNLSVNELLQISQYNGLAYTIGPFSIRLTTDVSELLTTFHQMYADLEVAAVQPVSDFHIQIFKKTGLRRWWHPQVVFSVDSVIPFEPYPLSHAFPLSEWGLNWCIGLSAHQYIMLHSAVLEYKGVAVILPAMPGSGKSTLCSALMLRGWRLLSDEFGLINPDTGRVHPMPRAIPLKNNSISVIRDFSDSAVLGPLYKGTRKGDVAHLAPLADSLLRQHETAMPAVVVFPHYQAGSQCVLNVQEKSMAFTRITKNSFNYYLSQRQGFNTLTDLIKQSDCYGLQYSRLDDAIKVLTERVEQKAEQLLITGQGDNL